MSTSALDRSIQSEIAQGWRLEHATADSAILSRGKRVNNVLHLIVSIIFWVWSVVWFIFTMTGGVHRKMLIVAETGQVIEKPVENGDGGVPTWAKIVSGILAVLFVIVFIALVGGAA